MLKAQKLRVNELETKVSAAKLTYNEALKNLEQISEDIHRQRQQRNNLLNYEAMLRQVDAVDALTAGEQQQPLGAAGGDYLQPGEEEEYLCMPDRLGSGASSPRQSRPDPHDCPHLLHDFEAVLTFPQKLAGGMHKSASTSATTDGDNNLFAQAQGLHGPYEVKPRSESGSSSLASASASASTSAAAPADNDIDQWTEIRLSHSDSTSSSYSNQSLLEQQGLDGAGGGFGSGYGGGNQGGLGYGMSSLEADAQSQHSTSSSDEPKRKVTCTTIFQDDSIALGGQQMSRKQSLSQWLSRSNSFKSSGRRQSLDLLIDAGDKVKDVFSYGFQKVGRSLERRNSESEMTSEGDEGDALLPTAAATAMGGAASTASSTLISFGSGSASGGGGGSGGGSGGGHSSSSASDFFSFSRSVDGSNHNNNNRSSSSGSSSGRGSGADGGSSSGSGSGGGFLCTLQNHLTRLM